MGSAKLPGLPKMCADLFFCGIVFIPEWTWEHEATSWLHKLLKQPTLDLGKTKRRLLQLLFFPCVLKELGQPAGNPREKVASQSWQSVNRQCLLCNHWPTYLRVGTPFSRFHGKAQKILFESSCVLFVFASIGPWLSLLTPEMCWRPRSWLFFSFTCLASTV